MDDLISRQAAIKALERTKEKDPKGDIACFYNTITNNKIAVIEALPPVQLERKRGKWVDGWSSGFDGTRHWFRECSVCGYGRDDDNPEKDTNFCPDCGADMREETDNG